MTTLTLAFLIVGFALGACIGVAIGVFLLTGAAGLKSLEDAE